jgi:N-acyl-D-aspartate/D-glutamate deacylase
MADLVIRNGTIVDGTGAPPYRGDVAITGSTITAVGDVDERGTREVDADGLLVTPGFVDIHTHFDGQVTWDTIVAPSSIHGVTTIAMGNCGVGFAPARPDRHAWLIGLLEGVEDIPGTALAEGLTWDWETFPQYLDALAAKPHTLDVAAHIPHAALRTYVMGDRGADHTEAPTDDELAQLAAAVGEGLDAGAIGFATSRTEVHRTKDGANIGTLTASERELLAIADVLAHSDHGVTQLISDLYQTADDEFADSELRLIEAFAELRQRGLENVKLLIIGDDISKYSNLRRLVHRHQLHQQVRFLGFVSTDTLAALYQLAQVFVFPSLYEGFGLPPLEAMANGTPVITSNVSSLPEVVGDAALLIDPMDSGSIADAMHRVLTDPALRADLVRRGRERVKAFSWDRSVARTHEIYMDVMRG